MNKREREVLFRYENDGMAAGLSRDELEILRRAALTLHRWYEHECNGTIQRDEETGKCYWYSSYDGRKIGPAADRETPAEKRVRAIAAKHGFEYEPQGDPRGWPIKLRRVDPSPEGEAWGRVTEISPPIFRS